MRFRGVDVGKVTDIRFDPQDPRMILVDDRDPERRCTLTRSTYAELRYQGVTGLSYVMLDDTGNEPASRCRLRTRTGSDAHPDAANRCSRTSPTRRSRCSRTRAKWRSA